LTTAISPRGATVKIGLIPVVIACLMVPTTITALRNTVRHRMDVCIPCLSVDATAPRPPTDGPRARRPWKVWRARVPLGLVTLRSLDFALGRGVVAVDDAVQRRRDAGELGPNAHCDLVVARRRA